MAVLLYLGVCLVSASQGVAQKISLSVKNTPLPKVLALVEAQSDYRFFYRWELLKQTKKVTLDLKNASLAEVLDLCLSGQALTYQIFDNTIVIRQTPGPNLSTTEREKEKRAVTTVVRGRIFTAAGEPVEGATVMVKGSREATASGRNGDFLIPVSDLNDHLMVSSVSTEPKEVAVAGASRLTIIVESRERTLDQVQIIGYGQTTRRLNTGNVTTVKAAAIEQQPVGHLLAALQGRVPGMVVIQHTGLAGGRFRALVRGQGSIVAGTNPLFIVDGVPYPDGQFGTNNSYKRGVNGLTLLNLNEIERIDVLKDADATAIYGSRGANGVILITTKSGHTGDASVQVTAYSGYGQLTVRPRQLDLSQYLQMRYEGLRNDSSQPGVFDYDVNGAWDTTRYTDWSNTLLGGTANLTDAKISVAGADGTLNFSINAGYHKETTVMRLPGSNQRYGIHIRLGKSSPNKKLSMDVSGTFQGGLDNLPPIDFTGWIMYLKPNQPNSFHSDGSLNYDVNGFFNPYLVYPRRYSMRQNNLLGRAHVSWAPAAGLEFRLSVGYNLQVYNDYAGNPSSPTPNTVSSAFYATNKSQSIIIEPQAFYKWQLNDRHKFSLLLGSTYQQSSSSFQNLYARGFTNDALLRNPAAATSLEISGFRYTNYKYIGSFSRVSYNLDSKYLVNLTGRVDGTSRFGPGKQFHPFGAAGVAWIMTEERLLRGIKWLPFAKVRGSYGVTGNSEISDYAFVETYAPFLAPYQGIQGLTPNQLFDRNLGWELKRSLEIALELQLLRGGRLGLDISVFRQRSSQHLQRANLSTVTGFYSVVTNRPSSLLNTGMEVVFYGKLVSGRQLTWTLNANASLQKNKLLSFEQLERSDYQPNLAIGYPVPVYKVFKFAGVDQQTGDYLFLDRNGHPTTTPQQEDKTEIINVAPRSFGGITNSLAYRNWSFEVTCMYVTRKGLDVTKRDMKYIESLSRWQKPGDVTTTAKYSFKPSMNVAINNIMSSTAGYGDASYFRVRNVVLGYDLKRLGQKGTMVKSMRVYLLAENLFTFTRAKQLDPENIDQLSMAPLRVVTAGFHLNFN